MLFKMKSVIVPKKLTLLNLDRLFKFIYNQNDFINLKYFKSTRFYNNKLSIQYVKKLSKMYELLIIGFCLVRAIITKIYFKKSKK